MLCVNDAAEAGIADAISSLSGNSSPSDAIEFDHVPYNPQARIPTQGEYYATILAPRIKELANKTAGAPRICASENKNQHPGLILADPLQGFVRPTWLEQSSSSCGIPKNFSGKRLQSLLWAERSGGSIGQVMLKTKDLLASFRNIYLLPHLASWTVARRRCPSLSIIAYRKPVQAILSNIPKELTSRLQSIQELQCKRLRISLGCFEVCQTTNQPDTLLFFNPSNTRFGYNSNFKPLVQRAAFMP